MDLHFDEEQLKADVALLEGKGIPTETATDIAQLTQVVQFATDFVDGSWYVEKGAIPEDVYYRLDNVIGILQDTLDSLCELFMTEEETAATVGIFTRQKLI